MAVPLGAMACLYGGISAFCHVPASANNNTARYRVFGSSRYVLLSRIQTMNQEISLCCFLEFSRGVMLKHESRISTCNIQSPFYNGNGIEEVDKMQIHD